MAKPISSADPQSEMSLKERAISVIAGLGLAAAATKPRPNPLLNVLALLGGGYLAYRGATGHCPIKQQVSNLLGQAQKGQALPRARQQPSLS